MSGFQLKGRPVVLLLGIAVKRVLLASWLLCFADVWATCRWLPSLTKGQRAYDEPYGLSNTAAADIQVIDYLLVPKQRPILK